MSKNVTLPTYPNRRNPRLKDYDYSQPGTYCITVCTSGKECFFGKIAGDQVVLNVNGRLVEEEWSRIGNIWEGVKLDVFMVMPNHIHGMVVVEERHSVGANQSSPDTSGARRLARPGDGVASPGSEATAVSPPPEAAGSIVPAPPGRASRPGAASTSTFTHGSPLQKTEVQL